ncbi:alpha/beta hydrolase [Pendulispora brunnea]|uniref:Alpha/beta hydrolase n=1 Tax=Pendulispora brunnea TaxID=2905690 RepID=A0ABZ2KJZ6_9BACT
MPLVPINGTRLYVEDTGSGSNGQTIVFSHGLLWSGEMFAAQLAHFRGLGYRCIAYDHRGQGRSDDHPGRIVTIELVYDDAVALLESLGPGKVHFAGLSMGGFVALRLAARRPDLLASMILLETSAEPEPRENIRKYKMLNAIARYLSLSLVANKVMPIMFGRHFLESPDRELDRRIWLSKLLGNRQSIYRAVNGVIERESIESELPRISCPSLIIVGEQDTATVPAKAERIQRSIAGSSLVRIPRAGHSSSIEQPEAVNAAIESFLTSLR